MSRKSVRVGLLALLLLGTGCERQKLPLPPEQQQALPQWPVWGGNLRHTANAADPVEFYVGPEEGREVWSRRLKIEVSTSPSIHSDGTIYVASWPGDFRADSGFVVHAFRPDGSLKWRFETEGPVTMDGGAVGQDGTYYIGDYKGNVYAIDSEGQLKWKGRSGSFNGGHPVITQSGVVIFPSSSKVSAFEARTGELLWEDLSEMQAMRGASVAADGTIYVGTNRSLLALHEDGTRLWEMPLPLGPIEVVIDARGTLYFQIKGDSSLYAVEPDGSLKWKFNIGAPSSSNVPGLSRDNKILLVKPIRTEHLVVVSQEGLEERRFSLAELAGTTDVIAVLYSSPVVDAEGTAYLTFLPRGGLPNFYAIRPTGVLKWKALVAPQKPLLYHKPALAPDGSLYITSDYELHCLR